MTSCGGSKLVKSALRQVKPLISLDKFEARRRVIALYKAWFRQIPFMLNEIDVPKTEKECKIKLKEEFLKNRNVTDIRVMDMLVIKGQIDLKEVVEHFKQKGHVMAYWKDTVEPKPQGFLGKFLAGNNN